MCKGKYPERPGSDLAVKVLIDIPTPKGSILPVNDPLLADRMEVILMIHTNTQTGSAHSRSLLKTLTSSSGEQGT